MTNKIYYNIKVIPFRDNPKTITSSFDCPIFEDKVQQYKHNNIKSEWTLTKEEQEDLWFEDYDKLDWMEDNDVYVISNWERVTENSLEPIAEKTFAEFFKQYDFQYSEDLKLDIFVTYKKLELSLDGLTNHRKLEIILDSLSLSYGSAINAYNSLKKLREDFADNKTLTQ